MVQIDEGNRAFAGTEWEGKWWIYHDPLKQFYEPDTMAYMASRGFTPENGRLLVSLRPGPYHNRTPGDTPEWMPLDSHLFADYKFECKRYAMVRPSLCLL